MIDMSKRTLLLCFVALFDLEGLDVLVEPTSIILVIQAPLRWHIGNVSRPFGCENPSGGSSTLVRTVFSCTNLGNIENKAGQEDGDEPRVQ